MKTKKAMMAQGLKYFSQLSSKQKDACLFHIKRIKYNLTEMPENMAKDFIASLPDLNINLNGCKMFKHEGIYYPLNIREILSS